jgi:hypothetical protein
MTGQWLFGSVELGHISPWNAVIAERHAAATERMLLGAAGRARVVGNRLDEAIIADRERRAAEMSRRAVA